MSPRRIWDPQPRTEPQTWPERVHAAAEESERRRVARRAEREHHARRRAHGLIDRHAARLAEARRHARVTCDTG
ncbi:hypothetical protein [Actinoplanes sp. M2I2]|uniref:hypothetical protein n=1 Tax=Actinoplanes sp. M2I2 TaxID=1734444 RepID=UPI002021F603|nr:hypothetical protein [Actinoplanes sp. M2I2]